MSDPECSFVPVDDCHGDFAALPWEPRCPRWTPTVPLASRVVPADSFFDRKGLSVTDNGAETGNYWSLPGSGGPCRRASLNVAVGQSRFISINPPGLPPVRIFQRQRRWQPWASNNPSDPASHRYRHGDLQSLSCAHTRPTIRDGQEKGMLPNNLLQCLATTRLCALVGGHRCHGIG